MENNTNLTLNAILNLKYILGIKNDYVLAEKLDIARNTISGIKKETHQVLCLKKFVNLRKIVYLLMQYLKQKTKMK